MSRYGRCSGYRHATGLALAAWVLGGVACAAGATESGACGADAPFTEDPAALLQLAAARSTDAGVELLRRRELYRFDESGRSMHLRHWVWRIGSGEAAAAEGWDSVEATWDPAVQELESLRARVITPDGQVEEVVIVEPGGGDGVLRAPLPYLLPGSLVEEEIVVRDLRSFSPGWSYRHALALAVPVAKTCLTLEAPITLPLRYGIRGDRRLAVAQTRLADARTRLRFETSEAMPPAVLEAGLPPDLPRVPMVVFSTGESWGELASSLAARLDTSVVEVGTEALLMALGLLAPGQNLEPRFGPRREAWIRQALKALREHVRFEPGYSAPGILEDSTLDLSESLANGRGGSLELATLLTGALRAGGVAAEVALIRRGPGQDVEPELPGLGLFDHALVYLPGRIPRWIDPSDVYSRVGQLGSSLQGRRALVLSASSRQLQHTPNPLSGDNRVSVRIDVYLAPEGPARIVETSVYRGALEHRQRRLAASLETRMRHLGYLDYLRSAYRAEELGAVEETAVDDLSEPYRLRLEAIAASRGFAGGGEAAFAFILRNLITLLPRELLPPSGPRRRGRFQFQEPFVAEWAFRIFPPEGFELVELPRAEERTLGSGHLSREAREEEGVVWVTFRLDSGPLVLTPETFESYRQAVEDVLVEEPLLLFFTE